MGEGKIGLVNTYWTQGYTETSLEAIFLNAPLGLLAKMKLRSSPGGGVMPHPISLDHVDRAQHRKSGACLVSLDL